MYKKRYNPAQTVIPFEEFALPCAGNLDASNRWVQLAKRIPWEKFVDRYALCFSQDEKRGGRAIPFRVGLGALIIRERLGVTDREALAQIRENPYLQYLLGFERFTSQKPFDPSLYEHFRKRISEDILAEVNEEIVKAQLEVKREEVSRRVTCEAGKAKTALRMMTIPGMQGMAVTAAN